MCNVKVISHVVTYIQLLLGNDSELKSDTAVLAVLPRYLRYYRRNGYKFYGITAVLGSKYTGLQWGWGPGLRYYRGLWGWVFLAYV